MTCTITIVMTDGSRYLFDDSFESESVKDAAKRVAIEAYQSDALFLEDPFGVSIVSVQNIKEIRVESNMRAFDKSCGFNRFAEL